MSPAAPSPLTVLTSPNAIFPGTTFTPPTIVALILLLLLTAFIFGTLLVFALRRRRSGTPASTDTQEASFLDLEAGSKKSPFFEVVDNHGAHSSRSVWSTITGSDVGSRSRTMEPELPWPVYTVLPHLRPKEPLHCRVLKALVFWGRESKCEPFTVADVQRAKEHLESEQPLSPLSAPARSRIWTEAWHKLLSLFRGKLPEIVIHPCDGSPSFPYVEDLDRTPSSLRERRLLARCEAALDLDFDPCPESADPQASMPTSLIAIDEASSASFHDEGAFADFSVPMRPSTPLGMASTDEPASNIDASSAQSHSHVAVGASQSGIDLEVLVSCFPRDEPFPPMLQGFDESSSTFSIHPPSTFPEGQPESAPSNSSSESSVADIISLLEEVSADSSSSSESLSIKTSFSDDSVILQSSKRKRFCGVFKRVSLQSLDLDLDLDADKECDFSRSTYYDVLGEYGGGRARDSVASVDSL
ncbi:hypothetical protein L226DRAFT_295298 [Lentinus tigrinus ALCF2SS1-7]|uniref:uncharacterized protein n=1 Tax=Lentinus tigrinus ALCF2SS1-7 TaxID=1328758 RepID=UPI0011663DD1|nr:hypothetical protein L226DRAFT_295298 [Lentinus tigrinus ALCF2SS1-7]